MELPLQNSLMVGFTGFMASKFFQYLFLIIKKVIINVDSLNVSMPAFLLIYSNFFIISANFKAKVVLYQLAKTNSYFSLYNFN